jgi:hypothetical protein
MVSMDVNLNVLCEAIYGIKIRVFRWIVNFSQFYLSKFQDIHNVGT